MIKVNIIGAESTGKTTLSTSLAHRYNAILIKEYAREYLDQEQKVILADDVKNIANVQINEFDIKSTADCPIIIYDTSLITSIIWLYDKFKCVDIDLHLKYLNQHFDITLLCYPDLPWEYDPLRSDRHRLLDIHKLYESYLTNNNKTYHTVIGKGQDRSNVAYNIIDQILVTL
jgi:nicotinamide riboside kinase